MNHLADLRRVLVLDDDDLVRDLLEALLSEQGFDVSVASRGAEALPFLSTAPPFHLVLTDLHMPELEGEALVSRLRSAMPTGALLIGMSASPAEPEVAGQLDSFLLKPFDLPALEQAVASARARPGGGEERVARTETARAGSTPDTGETDRGAVPPLNEEVFAALLKTLPMPQLVELYGLVLADVAKRHDRIAAAAAAGDLAEVQREAHAVKGGCGMVGASELQQFAAEIEGSTAINTAAIAEIPAACLRLQRMLDEKLQTT